MTTRFSSHAASALGLLAVLTFGSPARAEPSPSEIESARALYVEGLELRDRGDLATSASRFQAAQALAATPITTLELGRALGLLDRLLEAREVLLSVERLPVRPDESQKAAKARAEASALAEQLRTRIPSIVLRFAEPLGGRVPRVAVDGIPVPPEALASPRKLNPGKHTVIAELDGARTSAEVTLAAAEAQAVTLSFRGADRAGDGVAVTAPDKLEPAGSREAPGPWFYGGLAAAIGGVAVGSVTGIVAIDKSSELSQACTGNHCSRAYENDLSTGKTMAAVSTVAFVVAGVGTAVAVISWIARGTKAPPRTSALDFTLP